MATSDLMSRSDELHANRSDDRSNAEAVSPLVFFRHLAVAGCCVIGLVAVVGITFRASSRQYDSNEGGMASVMPGDLMIGKQLFARSCATCHGAEGEGMPQQGIALRGSAFVARNNDATLTRFVRLGRVAEDRDNMTGRVMPPMGGATQLTEEDLTDIIRFVRSLQPVFSLAD